MKADPWKDAEFNRFDIVEAWYLWLCSHHCGIVHDPPRSHRDWWCSYNRLSFLESKLHFKPAPNLSLETLTDNAREIYDDLCRRLGSCDCLDTKKEETNA
jgi:hypothetical protein